MAEGLELHLWDWRLRPARDTVREERLQQTGLTLALIGWKSGHSHWLSTHMGSWERTFERSSPQESSPLALFVGDQRSPVHLPMVASAGL